MKVDLPWRPPPGVPDVPEERPASMYRAYVPLEVRGPGGNVRLDALLDSGCDLTYCPADLLEPLGLTATPLATGLADFPAMSPEPMEYEVHEVEVCLAGRWMATMPVNFTRWHISHPDPLLGADPWFRQFRITLDGPGRMTTIEAAPTASSART